MDRKYILLQYFSPVGAGCLLASLIRLSGARVGAWGPRLEHIGIKYELNVPLK